MHAIARLQPQGPMRAMEVVIEELQVHQRIEGGIPFGESVRQTEHLGDDQTRTPPFARAHRLAVGPLQDAAIAMPAITEPAQGALLRPLERDRGGLLDQLLTQGAGGAGDHEATVAVLDQAAPTFSFVRLFRCSLFFCTNDQNSSISTWLRCRSLAITWVMATAWLAARLSHTLIVSYLCPVISSAARKLPRRITTNSAWATSAAGVFNPYIGVPSVSPK